MVKKKDSYFIAVGSKRVKVASHFQPVSITNPYDDTDYGYFEDAWANTLVGTVIDKNVGLTVGGGPKPILHLVNEKQLTKGIADEKAKQKKIQDELSAYDDLVDKLIDIDKKDTINFKQTITDATVMAKVFGRSVIAFEPANTDIPDTLKIIHPRDLGRIKYDKDTWALTSVNVFTSDKIMAEEMIYIVNKANNPIRKNIWYGYSDIQRVVGYARALRRIMEFDAPEIAQSMWADYGVIKVKTTGKSESEKSSMLTTIKNNIQPGAWNIFTVDNPDDLILESKALNAKVDALIPLIDRYERGIIGNTGGAPGPLFGREEESNMATLFGKIRLYLAATIKPEREWLGNIITQQWYKRNLIALGDESILQKVTIQTEFEPIIMEDWTDIIQAVQILKQTVPLSQKALLQLLNLEEFANELEEKPAPTPPASQQPQAQETGKETPMRVVKEEKIGEGKKKMKKYKVSRGGKTFEVEASVEDAE